MTPTDAFSARRVLIYEQCDEAQTLLIRATHEVMKEHVRTAMRSLADAAALLDEPSGLGADRLLNIVDANIESATLRLRLVDEAIRHHGPDATEP